MKTERRHELQTNELADSLARAIESIKPYSKALMGLVVGLVVLAFAWTYLAGQNSRRLEQGWTEYFDALAKRNPTEQLDDIATRYAGTSLAEWARLVLADIQSQEGTERLFLQKTEGRDELRQAAEKYRAVILESRQKEVLQHATFGLARAHEALGTTESLDEARKEYRSIGEKWPGCAYDATATARAKDLDELKTKSFYDWLAKYEPPKPRMTGPGQPGVKPDFLNDSFDQSIKLPTAIEKGAATTPSAGGISLDETSPAEKTPEAPAATEPEAAPPSEPEAPSNTPGETEAK